MRPIEKMHPEKIFLYALVRMYQPKRVAEIGVSQGEATLPLALGLKHNGKGLLTAVDNWSRKHGGKSVSPKQAEELLIENKCQEFVEFRSEDSAKFFEFTGSKSVDLVIVDADHSYKGCYEDTKQALRVAKQLVVIHDPSNFHTVREACAHLSISGLVKSDLVKFTTTEREDVQSLFVKPMRGYWLAIPK